MLAFRPMLAQERLPLAAGESRSLFGMDHDPVLWLAPPDGPEKGLQRQISCHPRLHRPAHPAP